MTISFRSFSEELHSPHLPIKAVALKEWAVCIDALAQGDQHILVRKGGIMEETRHFRLEETSFYLYPTYEHQRGHLIKKQYQSRLDEINAQVEMPPKQVTITHAAHVVDDISFHDEADLKKLDAYHILTHDYAAERLQWKAKEPLHILLLRVYRLTEPKLIDVDSNYIGCKSWITLKEPIKDTDLVPVLPKGQWDAMREELHDLLGLKHN